MAKTYDAKQLEEMSQEDLIALEDEVVAEEVNEADDNATASDPPVERLGEPAKADEVKPDKEQEVIAHTEEGEVKSDDAKTEPVINEEEKKHVSPPSKWAEQRRQNKELLQRAEEAEKLAAEAAATSKELEDLKADFAWMKTAITAKGVELPASPMETFSPEKIEEVRTEFGDELADMFSATATLLQKSVDNGTAKVVEDPAKKTKVEETVEPVKTSAQTDDEQEMWAAVQGNDDMSYWLERANDKENPSPLLWERAKAKDTELSLQPEFAKLTYPERFAKVVEAVKADVMSGATPPVKEAKDTGPGTDMGQGGVVSSTTPNTAYDKVMAQSDPDMQMKVYEALSQDDKDLVDKQLNI